MIKVEQTTITTATAIKMYFPYKIKNSGSVSTIGEMKFGLNL